METTDIDVDGVQAGQPAYAHLSAGGASQTQCSGDAASFCFFCAFEAQADDGAAADEHSGCLRSLVRALIAQRAEISTIVTKVAVAYAAHVRDELVWTNPVSNSTVVAPEWGREAIHRHLMHSSEFPELFEDSVERIFHNLICSYNANMMPAGSELSVPNQPIVENFLRVVRASQQYLESRNRLDRVGRRTRMDRGSRDAGKVSK